MPTVSVIVPNYNHAPYLRQRLDSIFNQTFQDFEVIILDDCSTDNSNEIIEEYRNRPQVSHVVYNETNSGSPFKQWAKGFDLAQGEYIWIAESDDWAELNFLEEMTFVLKKNQSLALTFCESYWESNGKTVKSPFPLASEDCFYEGKRFITEKQSFDNHIFNASSVVFRKKFLFQIRPLYKRYKGSGDYLLWIQLSEYGNVFYKHLYLNHFRRHESTTSRSVYSGLIYFENHQIFTYLKQKGYISFIKKHLIVLRYIKLIERDYKNNSLKNKAVFLSCKRLWKQEVQSLWISKIILFVNNKLRFLLP